MQRVAFRMKLNEGMVDEYKSRHDKIWPELKELLKQNDVQEYSIFLDEETLHLFGFLKISDPLLLDGLPKHPVMQKWWKHMKDIMDANEDNSPVSKPLKEVFYLP